jgi:DNA-directed RNA polymerase subunit M
MDDDFECRKCGFKKEKADYEAKITQKAKEDRETLVVDGKLDTLPKTKIRCPNCDHKEAYWVIRQMRAADEPETRIYRCVKCDHSWREN